MRRAGKAGGGMIAHSLRRHSRLITSRRWMLFVDGENFTRRGQDVLKAAGVDPERGERWCRDVFLWMPLRDATWPYFAEYSPSQPDPERAGRAFYYTSATADEPQWTDRRIALRELGFEPRMFKRSAGRSKAVDIALASDVLTMAFGGRYEVAVLFAGDGDYVPLVEAVKALGHYVVVGFFADHGLSPALRIAADEYIDLTADLVDSWKGLYSGRTRAAELAEIQRTAAEAKEAEAARRLAEAQALDERLARGEP
jgi:uncharacterized LabA/DUF88 family protein